MVDIETEIFNVNCDTDFEKLAVEIFNYQYEHNTVYRNWAKSLSINPAGVKKINEIPFLPIQFFKTQQVISCPEQEIELVFQSSGTGGERSKHFVKSTALYKKSLSKAFTFFYGNPEEYCFLALLPGYIERGNSSLVYMCNELINMSKHPLSGFYLNEWEKLEDVCSQLKKQHQKTWLIGVSYALLDFAQRGVSLNNLFTVVETGGMKGTRAELPKEELHSILNKSFSLQEIHSEYGMTEMLSQAYAKQNALLESPPWLRFLIRDTNDPFSYRQTNKTGGVNVIDLANLYSCSFIATQDLGKLNENGKLTLVGRFDYSDIRGCNLLLQ